MNPPEQQGFYCSTMDKAYVGLKYPLLDRVRLLFKRKRSVPVPMHCWKTAKSFMTTRSYNLRGEGLFNMGKDYGRVTEQVLIVIEENENGHQRAWQITSEERSPIDVDFASNLG